MLTVGECVVWQTCRPSIEDCVVLVRSAISETFVGDSQFWTFSSEQLRSLWAVWQARKLGRREAAPVRQKTTLPFAPSLLDAS